MEAKELMVGDIVSLFDEDGYIIPTKIKEIRDETVIASIDSDDIYDELDYEGIMPIPLTQEILENSGFGHHVTEEYSDSFDGTEGNLAYVFNKTTDGYMSCIDITHSFTITGLIKYVHELQHILRLCGIDKEIVIQ